MDGKVAQFVAGNSGTAAAAAAAAAGATHSGSGTAAGAAGASSCSAAAPAVAPSSSDAQPAGHSSKGFSVVEKFTTSAASGRLGFSYLAGNGIRYGFAAQPGCNLTVILSLAGSGNVHALGCDRPALHGNGLMVDAYQGTCCAPSEVDGFTVASQYGSAAFLPGSVQRVGQKLRQRDEKLSELCINVLRQVLAGPDLPSSVLVPPCACLSSMTHLSAEMRRHIAGDLVKKYRGRSFMYDPYIVYFYQVRTIWAA